MKGDFMVIVDEIIKTRNLNLFNECYKLNYVLYISEGIKSNVRNCDFVSSVVHSEILNPTAYSDDENELLLYAKNNNFKNYKIEKNPCKNKVEV